jgi:hypothetical protein
VNTEKAQRDKGTEEAIVNRKEERGKRKEAIVNSHQRKAFSV